MRLRHKILCCLLLLLWFSGGAHAENVLYLGDSHSVNTSLEESIYESFHRRGDFFVSEAVCSSKPNDWVDDPRYVFPCRFSRDNDKRPESGGKRPAIPQVSELVKKFGPAGFDIIIIEQGDNMLGSDRTEIAGRSVKLLRALHREAGDREVRYFWLGPTWPSGGDEFKDLKTVEDSERVRDGILDAIDLFKQESGRDCLYIDGMKLMDREWAQRQKGDALHFEPRGTAYREWGQKAAKVIENDLSRP